MIRHHTRGMYGKETASVRRMTRRRDRCRHRDWMRRGEFEKPEPRVRGTCGWISW